MNVMIRTGIVLIVLGLVVPIYGSITYASNKNVVETSTIDLQDNQKRNVSLPSMLGGISVAVGIVLIVLGRRRNTNGNKL